MYNPFKVGVSAVADAFRRNRKPVETPSVVHRVEVAGGRGLDPTTAVLSSFRRRATTHVLREQLPKRGMWVTYLGETYILANLEPGDVATIHRVLPDGTSVSEVTNNIVKTIEYHVPAASLTQAYLEDIPESRRPDPELAARFGYHSKATL